MLKIFVGVVIGFSFFRAKFFRVPPQLRKDLILTKFCTASKFMKIKDQRFFSIKQI